MRAARFPGRARVFSSTLRRASLVRPRGQERVAVASGNAIRGARVGAGPMRPTERAEPAPRRVIHYWCVNGHVSEPAFAAEAAVPAEWECTRCGLPAGRDPDNP